MDTVAKVIFDMKDIPLLDLAGRPDGRGQLTPKDWCPIYVPRS
jgi:hypothetical protein